MSQKGSASSVSTRVSRLTYVIPFGRYVGASQVAPNADEVLVGREGHRAYFVDLLISAGRRGAFLVTGRRGTGKTSFVRHCIAQYEASVFKRFLRHNVGRAFWDRVMVLLFWALLLLGALLLSELAQLLAPLALGENPHSMLLWVLLVPLGVALLFPCVYARAVFEVVVGSVVGDQRESTRFSHIIATIFAISTFIGLCFLPGLSSPSWSASGLFTILAALYLGGQSVFHKSAKEGNEDQAQPILPLVIISIVLITGSLAATFYSSHFALRDGHWKPVAINLIAASFMLGGGLILRGWYQGLVDRSLLNRYHKAAHPHESSPLGTALFRGAINYIRPGALFLAAALALSLVLRLPQFFFVVPVIISVLVGLVGACIEYISFIETQSIKIGPSHFQFHPKPRLILVAGAVVSMVLALQLAYPVVWAVTGRTLQTLELPGEPKSTSQTAPSLPTLAQLQHYAETPQVSSDNVVNQSVSVHFVGCFENRFDALWWLALALLTLALLHFIHYEWIVRPNATSREEEPPNLWPRPPWEDQEVLRHKKADKRWRHHHRMAALSLPWAVYRVWLPSLAIGVNLGVDAKLGTDQVIQAMLVGLRNAYYRTFTSWTAGPANIGRVGVLLILFVLVTLAGDAWFKLPSSEDIRDWSEEIERTQVFVDGVRPKPNPYRAMSPCAILAETRAVRQAHLADIACRLGPGWFKLLYLNLIPEPLRRATKEATLHPRFGEADPADRLILYSLLPYRKPKAKGQGQEAPPPTVPELLVRRWKTFLSYGVHLNTYHILLFLGFLITARSVSRKLPLLPYRSNLQRIDDLLDSMTARTRVTQRPTIWEPARWVYNLVADRVRETEREPLDPRTVELVFLHIMDDIQRGGIRLPGIARNHLHLPAPEITFIFDELDKLEPRLDPEGGSIPPQASELRALQADQERSLHLRRLLSDLKNILSTAPARFIFIGGRNLHDEWLADQTARQPLLTNIFNAEIYLPSLLTDRRRTPASSESNTIDERHYLHTRVEEYTLRQYQRAKEIYKDSTLKGFRSSAALAPSALSEERFATVPTDDELAEVLDVWRLDPATSVDCISKGTIKDTDLKHLEGLDSYLVTDFVSFLSLRSMGNPKRLKELLASFIRPLERVVEPQDQWKLPCQDVLRFRDGEVFRIQLIASIYRQLIGGFEERMVERDDKMAISIFFLSDFLFKFHRRAFSWANLERVDELAHIHRTPDLREIQEEMVELVSERFLHRVLNGMYSFRFRSDVAREVEYLSRISPPEMAALNFTLDESQSLKAIYRGALERREKREGSNPSLVAGLGELYEFDQEYETARHHYRRAIDLLDQRLIDKTGLSRIVNNILRGHPIGMEQARVFLPWGETRLRLMLQIGMTYELSRNLEHAVTEYRAARTLARALINAYLGLDENNGKNGGRAWRPSHPNQPFPTPRIHAIKNLNVLFQPLFAEAWVSEKIHGTVDTSDFLVEGGLWQIRTLLPFVQSPMSQKGHNLTETDHANLALTISQLHNKAGDLYFFKGRQALKWADLKKRLGNRPTNDKDSPSDGYLLRAHYHYAVSLHEIRRYIYHRLESSPSYFSLDATGETKVFVGEELPDILYRAIANSINDMAEAALGRVSLMELTMSITGSDRPDIDTALLIMKNHLLDWLTSDNLGTRQGRPIQPLEVNKKVPTLEACLGKWTGTYRDERRRLLEFEGPHSAIERILLSVALNRIGAWFFEQGGYLENAARELLQLCWIITRVLWWCRSIRVLGSTWVGNSPPGPKSEKIEGILQELKSIVPPEESELLTSLAEFAIRMLGEAKRLFKRSRFRLAPEEKCDSKEDQFGKRLPPDVLTLTCSIALWLQAEHKGNIKARTERKLRSEVTSWNAAYANMEFADILRSSLEWYRCPTLNRLNALKTLVDSYALSDDPLFNAGIRCSTRTLESAEEGLSIASTRHRIAKDEFVRVCKQGTAHELAQALAELSSAVLGLRRAQTSVDILKASRVAHIELNDMIELNEQYAAPLHFTPHQGGSTCAFLWLKSNYFSHCKESTLEERVFTIAQRDLRASEEICTLRHSFYECISDLYYLYDDFNDRQIHYKHALQMMGVELTTILRTLLEVE